MGLFRLILAYMVVVNHTDGYSNHVPIDLGIIAVSVFFFISGYLMPLAFQHNYNFGSLSKRIGFYFFNRFLRIYPMYWLSLFIATSTIVIRVFILRINADRTSELLNPLIWLQNILLLGLNQDLFWGRYYRFNNPAWTLDVELQYYLIVPFLVLAYARNPKILTGVLFFLSGISLYFMGHETNIMSIDRSLLTYSILFFAGFFLYQTTDAKLFLAKIDVRKIQLLSIGVVSVSLLLFTTEVITIVIILTLLVNASYLLLKQENRMFGEIDATLGDLSYPVYIFHIVLIGKVQWVFIKHFQWDVVGSMWQFGLLTLINILITTIFSVVAIKLIDKPIQKIRNRVRASALD